MVQTVGKQNEVIDAIREVISLTRETPIKGPVHNYDPLNYDRMYADEYGGYGNIPGSSRPSRDGGRRSGDRGDYGRGGGGGRNDDRSRSGGRRENPFVNPWAADDGGFNGGGGGSGGFGGANFGGGNGGGFGAAGGNNFGASGGFANAGVPMGGNNFGGGGGGFGNQGGFGTANNAAFGAGGGFPGAGAQGGFGGAMSQGGNFSSVPSMGNGMVGPSGSAGFGANGNVPNNITGTLPEGHDPKNSTQVSIPKDVSKMCRGVLRNIQLNTCPFYFFL